MLLHYPCKWLFSLSHPKLNLNLFLTSRFCTMILTYLCFSPSDLLHSSICPLYSEWWLLIVFFQNKRDTHSFSCSFVASNMMEVYIFLPRLFRNSPLQPCPFYSPISKHNWSTAYFFFVTTWFVTVTMTAPESSSQISSTQMSRASTMCQVLC